MPMHVQGNTPCIGFGHAKPVQWGNSAYRVQQEQGNTALILECAKWLCMYRGIQLGFGQRKPVHRGNSACWVQIRVQIWCRDLMSIFSSDHWSPAWNNPLSAWLQISAKHNVSNIMSELAGTLNQWRDCRGNPWYGLNSQGSWPTSKCKLGCQSCVVRVVCYMTLLDWLVDIKLLSVMQC